MLPELLHGRAAVLVRPGGAAIDAVRAALPSGAALLPLLVDPRGRFEAAALPAGMPPPSAEWEALGALWVVTEPLRGAARPGRVLLELPPLHDFLEGACGGAEAHEHHEDARLALALDTAWRVSRSLRSAGVVTSLCALETRTLVEIALDGFAAAPRGPAVAPRTAPRVQRTGWGGGGRVKTRDRSSAFRAWLAERFGAGALRDRGVVDVAGGKGELAFKLVNYAGVPTTIVDPRPPDLANMLKHLTRGQVRRLAARAEPGAVVRVPLPQHLRCWFWSPGARCADQRADYAGETLVANTAEQQQRLEALLEGCAAIVGMHPDQATEAIVDWGLHLGKPFAAVPCCVFPNLFPHRREVRTHEQFCRFLVAKDPERVVRDKLDFAGRNDVICSPPVVAADAPAPPALGEVVVPSWSPLAAHLREAGEDHGDVLDADQDLPEPGGLDLARELEGATAAERSQEGAPADKARPCDKDTAMPGGSAAVSDRLLDPRPLLEPRAGPAPAEALPPVAGWLAVLLCVVLALEGYAVAAALVAACLSAGLASTIDPMLELELAAGRLESACAASVRTVRLCELERRGYRLGAAFEPPISRIERNACLREGDGAAVRARLECVPRRRRLHQALRAAAGLYRAPEPEEAAGPPGGIPLLCELTEQLLAVGAARAAFMRTVRDGRAPAAHRAYVVASLRRIVAELGGAAGAGRSSSAAATAAVARGPSPATLRALDAACSAALAASAQLESARERLAQGGDRLLLGELLDGLDERLASEHRAAEQALAAALGGLASAPAPIQLVEPGEGDADEASDEEQRVDNPAPRGASAAAEAEGPAFTAVYQGLLPEPGRLEVEARARGPSPEEEERLRMEARTAGNMLGELARVLAHKDSQRAPVRVVTGRELDDAAGAEAPAPAPEPAAACVAQVATPFAAMSLPNELAALVAARAQQASSGGQHETVTG